MPPPLPCPPPVLSPRLKVARGVIGVMVVGHWPLNHMPARLAFADLMATFFDVADPPGWAQTAFTLTFVAVSLGSAMVVSLAGARPHARARAANLGRRHLACCGW